MKHRMFMGFAIGNLVLCLWMFRDALWGGSLLAPLDILPAVCSKYQFMDPQSSGIPANQFIVDQITYDLPIQHTIHAAYQRGEIPWWDSLTWAGRPLLADAHINGTDPIRVLNYLTLPFELAYNWTRIMHFVVGGLAMMLLLYRWRFPDWVCVWLALTYEFAGCQVLYFGHPWIQASFNYYPLLWLAWDAWFQNQRWRFMVGASFAVAGVFYSGNLQSHSYLVLFAAVVGLGYGGLSWNGWKKIIPVIAVSIPMGATLAMPVLLGEVELYTRSIRSGMLQISHSGLAGVASISAVYPWALGTFRTLDLAKIFGASNMGFHLFIGSAGVLLALLGSSVRPRSAELVPVKRVALWLVALYFVIVCTPLNSLLYARSAGLGVLGLIVLAALGMDQLVAHSLPLKRWAWLVASLVVIVGVVTNVASLLIYPKFLPKVREMVLAQSQKNSGGLDEARALREFQVNNLANEVSFKNPETVIACVGMLGFAGVCFWPAMRRRRWALPALLAINLVPLIMFGHRFVPVQPISLWQRLMADNTEQRRVASVLSGAHERLLEVSRAPFERLYPNALGHLFQVHTVHGYCALQPRSFTQLSADQREKWLPQTADYLYETKARGDSLGELKINPTPGLARFQWADETKRAIKIESESFNEIRISLGPGDAANLIRTDTFYPGWSARVGDAQIPIQEIEPFFSKLKIPAGPQTLVLHYTPTYLRLGVVLAFTGLGALCVASLVAARFCVREGQTIPA